MLSADYSTRFSDRVIRDTSLSFEARSLFLLIDALSVSPKKPKATSVAILASATGWTPKTIEQYGSELAAHKVIMEVPGPEKHYVIMQRPKVGSRTAKKRGPRERPSVIFSKEILTQEEISALLSAQY